MTFAAAAWTAPHTVLGALVASLGAIGALTALLGAILASMRRAKPAVRYRLIALTFWLAVLCPLVFAGAIAAFDSARFVTAGLLHRASATNGAVVVALLTVWLAGAALGCLRLVGGLLRLRSLRAAAPPRRLHGVEVRPVNDGDLSGPAVVGWRRPCVLTPIGCLERLTDAELELLLRHERAHIARGDFLANLLQRAAACLLWFHPAVHWMAALLRAEREFCCDDAVGGAAERWRFAQTVATLAAARRHRRALALGAADDLSVRIRRLLGESPAPRFGIGPVFLHALLACAVVWAAVPKSAEKASPSASSARSPSQLYAKYGCSCN